MSDGQVVRLLAFKNPGSINADLMISVEKITAIAHQAARLDKLTSCKGCRHRITDGQCCELLFLADKKGTAANHERAYPQFAKVCEDLIKVAFGASVQNMKFQSEHLPRGPDGSYIYLGKSGKIRVDEKADDIRLGYELVKQL